MQQFENTESEQLRYTVGYGYVRNVCRLDFSNIDTGNVTDMGGMFNGFYCSEGLALSSFNTENVTDMSAMFEKSGLGKLDLSGFNTSKVINMMSIFHVKIGLPPNVHIYKWQRDDGTEVKEMPRDLAQSITIKRVERSTSSGSGTV